MGIRRSPEPGHWIEALFSLLFPSPCRVCQGPLLSHRSLICGSCWDAIQVIEGPICPRCGIPFPSAESQAFASDFLCGSCRLQEPPFHQARSVGYYEGTLREAIHLFKFGRREEMGRHLGALMVDHFPAEWEDFGLDLIVPIPLHPRRRRQRGFNQSLILGEALARAFDLRLHGRLLSRARPTLPQSDLPLSEKFANLKGAFEVRRTEEMEGKNILLVDDIYTSGATAQEASKTLLKAGAERVFVYTLARSVLR
ncbi:MAG: ComF family protein [candidate division NC10 bacterium]|nr:ComF family protein [candidate division NC10 bacterium]